MISIVIIGTGLAGYNLAREIRKLSDDAQLTLVTRDDGAFYSKPMLSNALAKQKAPDDLPMADADKMQADLKATIYTNATASEIDPQAKTVKLENGEVISYDKLVLATGAKPIQFPMNGDGVDDVLVVNNLRDYRIFRDRLEGKKSVAIIGPGLIGCEFANDLVANNFQVTVIGPDKAAMGTLLPNEAGKVLQDALSEQGVKWCLQTTVSAINKTDSGLELTLSDGQTILADVVLSAIGLKPDIQLAEQAGIETGRGVIVNRQLQSSNEHIYVLGDCAEVEGLVLPFVMPLMNGARALAATLCGNATDVNYPAMPVLVKTPTMPTVVSPPPRDAQGNWEFIPMDYGIKALFRDGDRLLGFALLGDAANEKMVLTKELPPVLQ